MKRTTRTASTFLCALLTFLPSAAFAEEPPLRANELNYYCGADGGLIDGECGFMLGCLLSEAIGGFDCYQEIEPDRPPYWPNPMPEPNPVFPDNFPFSSSGGGVFEDFDLQIEPSIKLEAPLPEAN